MSAGPDLAAMLAERAVGGAPPGAGPPPSDPMLEGGERSTVSVIEEMEDHVKMALQLAQEYDSVEQDAVDRKTMADLGSQLAKIQATLVGYKANEQKQEESALGVTPASKYVRKRIGGAV